MQKIESQLKSERDLYRELFISAEKSFKTLIKKLKTDFSCINCKTCCNVRYSNLPPEEIFRLAKQENDEIANAYMQLFVPYGAQSGFKYTKESKIAVEENNKSAQSLENELYSSYVEKILSKNTEPVYFYYCKYLDKENNCTANPNKCFLCQGFPASINTILPENCCYRHWQNLVLHRIKNEIEPEIELKIKEILDYRKNFKCNRTGTCCKLAGSEFSYSELKEKAANNDEFARQFTEIFVPYKNIGEARKVFPEYVDLVVSRLGENEKINFYYCKHLQGKNTCPIYENRPQICRDFPENPLSIIPPQCGFYAWKEDVLVAAYTFHAMNQIYSFYFEKIKEAI